MRRTLVALVIGALTLAPGATPVAAAARPLRLTVGTLGTIGSLDPRHGSSQIAREVWNLQYPTLTSLDPKTLDPAPGLAAAWTPAPGGKGWDYTLRRGLRWSDGRPVTAEDVVSSIERADAGRARALSTRQVEIVGNRNAPEVPVNIVPEHVLAAVGDLDKDLRALGVADGTWHVTARTPDSVQLDATRPGGPPVEQIAFRTYPNADALISALDRKEVDVVSGLPYADATRLAAISGVTVDHAPDGTQYVLRDNLSDARARRAISLAIDRTELVTDAVDGVGTPGVVPILARGASWALDAATVRALTSSLDAQPDRARRLLADAVHPHRPLRLAAADDATSHRVATYVAGALETVGLPTEIVDQNGPDDLSLARRSTTENQLFPAPRRPSEVVPTDDYLAQVARYRSVVERLTRSAETVGLFEPDTLQAFRSDNVAGWLRTPDQPSLVVFAPTTVQYSQLIAAPPPPGEQLSNTAYALGAAVVLAFCGAVYAIAAWIRRRSIA